MDAELPAPPELVVCTRWLASNGDGEELFANKLPLRSGTPPLVVTTVALVETGVRLASPPAGVEDAETGVRP